MFFATYVLTQKGPLAKVWLAAHWDKKLTSKDVKVIDLKQTIVHVVQPSVPIALRTSGELMLGIVRIYALKVANLLKDATEATSVLLKPRAVNMVKIPINNKVDGSSDQQQQQKDGNSNNNQQQQFQNAVAITMDVTVNRIGADQLCDADFAEVADLLNDNNKKSTNNAGGNNNNNKNKQQQQEDDANWWFATDASQAVEEVQYTSRHDAEMAKFRAELNKSSAANSKSTKGSSGSGSTGAGSSSVEQARGDNNADNNNNNKQNAAAGEFVPPTAEQEKDFLMMGGADGTDTILNLDAVLDHAANNMQQQPDGIIDSGDLPNFNNNNAEEDAAAAAASKTKSSSKKLRMVIVLDAETSLKPEALKKMAENRSDIVNSERRHGPLDEGEVQDRTVLRDEAIVTDCSSLACYFNNDVLRAAFHSAVQAVATERISEIEKIRSGGNNNNRASNNKENTSNNKKQNLTAEQQQQQEQQQHLQQPTFDDEDFSAMMNNNNNNNFDEMHSAGRRRGRHGDDENEQQRDDSFSASTVATLKNLRENLLAAGAKSCSFRTMIHGMAKQSACRTFVDLLHLASHQFVGVAQKEPFGAITVSRGPKFASTAKQ